MISHKDVFSRAELLAGSEMMKTLSNTRVAVFGVGGVGSWCVEALARTGIGHFTLIDPDAVAPSNINRQLPALHSTVGRPKVEVLAQRIADINPQASVNIIIDKYTPENADSFDIENHDFVVDAIDSLHDKAHLILRCTDAATAPRRDFFSSMGAARKMHPHAVEVAEFWKVQGCPLARALRTVFRRSATFPASKFQCVFSPERLQHRSEGEKSINGTFCHATAVFGLTLASLIVEKIYQTNYESENYR